MKIRKIAQGLVLGSVIIGMLALSSCTTTNMDRKDGAGYLPIAKQEVQMLGPVRVTMTSVGLLGISAEQSLIHFGGNSYDRLLAEAKKLGADDVLNITVDVVSTLIAGIYNQQELIVNGIAVKYTGKFVNDSQAEAK